MLFLVLLIHQSFRKTSNKKNSIAFALCLSIPYGGILEILQQELFEDRTADLFDFIANTFGCFLAWFYINLKMHKTTKNMIYNYLKNKG